MAMAADENTDTSVSIWWVLLFVLVALGLAAVGVLAVGGHLIAPPTG